MAYSIGEFARLSGISLTAVPGFDPDRDYFGRDIEFPAKNINHELPGFIDKLIGEPLPILNASSIDRTPELASATACSCANSLSGTFCQMVTDLLPPIRLPPLVSQPD